MNVLRLKRKKSIKGYLLLGGIAGSALLLLLLLGFGCYIILHYRHLYLRDHAAMTSAYAQRLAQDLSLIHISMGSMQTSITVGKHPELFAWAGLFSGFMHDLTDGGPDNSHLETMKAPDFNENMHLFFRAMGRQDEFWDKFAADDVFCDEHHINCVRKEYEGGHDWNVWRKCIRDFLSLVFQK